MRIELKIEKGLNFNRHLAYELVEQIKNKMDKNGDVIVFPKGVNRINNLFAEHFNNFMIQLTGNKDPYSVFELEAHEKVTTKLYADLYSREYPKEIRLRRGN